MQFKWYIRYSMVLFFKMKSRILILMILLAIFEFAKGVEMTSNYFIDSMQPLYIKKSLHINDANVLLTVDTVDFIYKYKMSVQTICIGEFSTKSYIIGIEDKKFAQVMKESDYVQPSGAMPYVLIKEDLLDSLKSQEGKTLEMEDNAEILTKDMEIVNSDGVSSRARICGVINKKNYKSLIAFTSVVNEKYEEIENIIMVPIEAYDMMLSSSTDDIKTNSISKEQYLICISKGIYLDNVIDAFQKNNIPVEAEIEQILISRSKEIEGSIKDFLFGIFLLIYSVWICKIKWLIWQKDHEHFIEYINRPKAIKRLGNCYIAWHILLGTVMGVGVYMLYFINKLT